MAAVRKIDESLQSAEGDRHWLDWWGPGLVGTWSAGLWYLGSMPCIRISSCLHSTMSMVNMAWKYGMEAASTTRWALNL